MNEDKNIKLVIKKKNVKIKINNKINDKIYAKIDDKIIDKINDNQEILNNKEKTGNKYNDTLKNNYVYDLINRLKVFKSSVKINWIFWITFTISIVVISIKYGTQSNHYYNITAGIYSIIASWSIGLLVHLWSHVSDFEKLYEELIESNNCVSRVLNMLPDFFHKFNLWFLRNIVDFHDKIHHNTEINNTWYNEIMEFIQNMLMEGGFLIILGSYLNLSLRVFNENYVFNNYVLLLWAIVYSSVHIINYQNIFRPLKIHSPHVTHHVNSYLHNFGPDPADILFGTKYNVNDLENINHYSFNIIVATILIIFLKEKKILNNYFFK
tara:strand:+ start:3730 stop:4701 length:972 start_codon:yes stop_codon:yes gene_type:complete